MVWFGTFLAFAIWWAVLDGAPIRQMLVLIISVPLGIQYGWEAGSWAMTYNWIIGLMCLVGFILSPMLWVCFGFGVFVGQGGLSSDD